MAKKDEEILRQLLWLNHGCDINTLYGDDGEMQCGSCGFDFVRMSAPELEAAFIKRGLARYKAAQGGKSGKRTD